MGSPRWARSRRKRATIADRTDRAAPLSALLAPIDLGAWRRDDEFEYHPIGSKPKRNYICPAEPPCPLLIPGHTYLFKVAEGRRAGQMWSEALAFQFGFGAGLVVPPCFVAFDPTTGEWGALIEFFVGYPGEARPDRLIHGADLLQNRGFTVGADRPHNVHTNIDVCAELGVSDAVDWWTRVVTFDTLIGNTDRHTENWGVLLTQRNVARMAPVFDNGTSLGYMQPDERLPEFRGAVLERFISRGEHHLSWDLANETRTRHMDLFGALVRSFDNAGAAARSVIQGILHESGAALGACMSLEAAPPFTSERAAFVGRLLERRGELMLGMLRDRS